MSNLFAIIPAFNLILTGGIGIFTLLRNPRQPSNIGFAIGMASLAIIEAGNTLTFFPYIPKTVALKITFTGMAAMPSAWLFFSIVFARANHKELLSRWAPVLAAFCLTTLFFIFTKGTSDLVSDFSQDSVSDMLFSNQTYFVLSPLGRYFFIYLILGLMLNLVLLENVLRSSKGSKKWQIKYIIFGLGSILAYFIYLSSQAILLSSINFALIPLTSSVILISTSIMAVFIVRHRLFDVDIFISRYVVYNSLTVFIVGLYLLAVGIITHSIKYFNIPFSYFLTSFFVFISILGLVILLFLASLRRKIQLFINRHFYKHKYEFRDKWMETIEKINSKRTVEEIKVTLKEMVSENMGARLVILWLYDAASKSYVTEQEDVPSNLKKIRRNHPLAEQIGKEANPFIIKDLMYNRSDPGSAIIDIIAAAGIKAALCAPLVADNELIGFILQGEDISGEAYRQDDLDFIKALATQAAVHIKTLRLTQEVLAFKEVEAFGRMSSFITHDLKNLMNSLSLTSQNARHNMANPEFQHDTIKTIDGTVSRMKDLMEKLSHVRKGLELRKADCDVRDIINRVLKKMMPAENKQIVIKTKLDDIPPIHIDPEQIEMVFLNIVLNAYEAISGSGEIIVQAFASEGLINVKISDNGPGITADYLNNKLFRPFTTTKKNGFGIGLYQCKAVVEAHGGCIDVESREGKGTCFTIQLPMHQNTLHD